MILDVIEDLNKKFNIDPTKAILENMEYGVNIIPPIETRQVIKNLIAYKSDGFKTFSQDWLFRSDHASHFGQTVPL
jgi:hypothetical protein